MQPLPQSSFRTFPSSQKDPLCPFAVSPTPMPRQPLNLPSVSVDLPFLHTSYKWNYTICSLCDWLLSYHSVFLRFIYIVAHISTSFLLLNITPFFGCTFCLLIHQLMNLLIHQLTFGLFPILAVMNNASVDIHVQVFVWICFHSSRVDS